MCQLSILCIHLHQQRVFLGRLVMRVKSHAVCGTRPGVSLKEIFTRTLTEGVEIRAEKSRIIINNG